MEHGIAENGPVDGQLLKAFDDKGYLVIGPIITKAELAELQEELERLAANADVKADDCAVVETKSYEVRSIYEAHKTNEIIMKVANDPRLVRRSEQILGSQGYIHQNRINYKPGLVGKEFSWHSDFESWHTADGMPEPRTLSISILLTDNYSSNGPLMIMPSSHKTYISVPGATPTTCAFSKRRSSVR